MARFLPCEVGEGNHAKRGGGGGRKLPPPPAPPRPPPPPRGGGGGGGVGGGGRGGGGGGGGRKLPPPRRLRRHSPRKRGENHWLFAPRFSPHGHERRGFPRRDVLLRHKARALVEPRGLRVGILQIGGKALRIDAGEIGLHHGRAQAQPLKARRHRDEGEIEVPRMRMIVLHCIGHRLAAQHARDAAKLRGQA